MASAYIGDFDIETYIPLKQSATVDIVPSNSDLKQLEFGTETYDYNCKVSNNSDNALYVFLEFDSALINGNPLYIPEAATGWVLYKDTDTVKIGDKNYRQYIFAYSSDYENMTALPYGEQTGEVFSSIMVHTIESETEYYSADTTYNVVARSVVTTSNTGLIDAAWAQVPKGYKKGN